MRSFLAVSLSISLSILAAGCAAAPTEDAESSTSALDAITFDACPIITGGTDTGAECANIDVPLDWAKPEGKRANFFVKRVKGSAPGPHKQLWLLQGGPGAAGDGFDYAVKAFQSLDPALDLYIPDHRGTGRSTYLGCTSVPLGSPMAACTANILYTWGADGLATFNTTTAARDVGYAIDKLREPNQDVHVYGVSYGTYLAQRYLQVFPSQATSVTLDSVCQSGLCSLLKYSYWTDHVAKAFMATCAADEFCSQKLGPDPVKKVEEAVAKVEAGTCPGLEGLPAIAVRTVLGRFAVSDQTRTLVPAITYRILRCSEGDVAALKHLKNLLMPPPAPPPPAGTPAPPPRPPMSSQAITFNIAFSEMMESPAITREALQELMRDTVFTKYSPATHDLFDSWPKYARDPYVDRYPETDTPVLILNGTLDGATPIEFAEVIAPHYTKPHQTFVRFPGGSHGVVFGTRMTTPGLSCGRLVMKSFLANPKGTVDTSCLAELAKDDFKANPQLATTFFGVPDLWDNVVDVAGGHLIGATDPSVQMVISDVRKALAGDTPSY